MAFITDVYNRNGDEGKDISVDEVHEAFKAKFGSAKINEVFEPDSEYDVGRTLAKDFLERSGFQDDSLPQVLMNGVPLGRNIIFISSIKKTHEWL